MKTQVGGWSFWMLFLIGYLTQQGRQSCQLQAPAALYSQGNSLYSLLLETGWAPMLLNNGQKQEIT